MTATNNEQEHQGNEGPDKLETTCPLPNCGCTVAGNGWRDLGWECRYGNVAGFHFVSKNFPGVSLFKSPTQLLLVITRSANQGYGREEIAESFHRGVIKCYGTTVEKYGVTIYPVAIGEYACDDSRVDEFTRVSEDCMSKIATVTGVELPQQIESAPMPVPTSALCHSTTAYLRPKCRKAVALIKRVALEMDAEVVLSSEDGKSYRKRINLPDSWLVRDNKGKNKIIPEALLSANRSLGYWASRREKKGALKLQKRNADLGYGDYGDYSHPIGDYSHPDAWSRLARAVSFMATIPVTVAGGIRKWWKKPGLYRVLVEKVKNAEALDLGLLATIFMLVSIFPLYVVGVSYENYLKATHPAAWIAEQERRITEVEMRRDTAEGVVAEADLTASSIAPITTAWVVQKEAELRKSIRDHTLDTCPCWNPMSCINRCHNDKVRLKFVLQEAERIGATSASH